MHTIYAKDREEWNRWLKENYKKETEVLLVFYKTSTGKASINWEESVEEALRYGWIDGVRKKVDDEKYSIRYSRRKPGSIWSLINKQKAEKLIQDGKMTEEGLRTIEEAKKSGAWEDTYSMKEKNEPPADMKEAIMKNPKAWEHFEKLSNSNKFTYIFQIKKIKTKQLREERIKRVVYLLEKNIKPYIDGKPSINNPDLFDF